MRRAILPAYGRGLQSTGFDASPDQIEQGFLISFVVRSMFTALRSETPGQPDSLALRDLLIERLRLTRHLLQRAAQITR